MTITRPPRRRGARPSPAADMPMILDTLAGQDQPAETAEAGETAAPAAPPARRRSASTVPHPQPDTGSAGREFELKFAVNEATLASLKASPVLGEGEFRRAQRLTSVYFDTPDHALKAAGLVLRIRRKRTTLLLAAKWAVASEGLFARGEHEVVCPSPAPDLSLLGPEIAERIRAVVKDEPLLPVFTTDIRRSLRLVRFGGSTIELALDTGTVVAGMRSEPIREIEIELKDGSADAIYDFAAMLAKSCALSIVALSKSERGFLLASGKAPKVARTPVAPLAGAATVDDLIAGVIGSCIQQFVSNWPAFQRAERVDAVHQMRVSLRRLRAMVGLFNRAYPSPAFTDLRNEAKRIASAMGDARNWDVFAEMVRNGPMVAVSSVSGFGDLLAGVEERRRVAYAEVRALLEDPATTQFVIAAEAFVARRGWRTALATGDLSGLAAAPQGFAADSLSRLDRKVRKRGRGLADKTAEERHEVRIALKGLRYAAELYAPLFTNPGDAKQYTAAAARVQDTLGSSNDMAVAGDLVTRLPPAPTHVARAQAVGVVLGWFARGLEIEGRDIRKTWKGFRTSPRFWT